MWHLYNPKTKAFWQTVPALLCCLPLPCNVLSKLWFSLFCSGDVFHLPHCRFPPDQLPHIWGLPSDSTSGGPYGRLCAPTPWPRLLLNEDPKPQGETATLPLPKMMRGCPSCSREGFFLPSPFSFQPSSNLTRVLFRPLKISGHRVAPWCDLKVWGQTGQTAQACEGKGPLSSPLFNKLLSP